MPLYLESHAVELVLELLAGEVKRVCEFVTSRVDLGAVVRSVDGFSADATFHDFLFVLRVDASNPNRDAIDVAPLQHQFSSKNVWLYLYPKRDATRIGLEGEELLFIGCADDILNDFAVEIHSLIGLVLLSPYLQDFVL